MTAYQLLKQLMLAKPSLPVVTRIEAYSDAIDAEVCDVNLGKLGDGRKAVFLDLRPIH